MAKFVHSLRLGLQTRPGMAAALLLLMLVVVLPGQWSIPPIDRDEPRFAQATRQMVASGDFVDIRYLDGPRHLQPAGIYWLQSAVLTVTGQADAPAAIWPHRIPSWLSAIGVALLTWWVGALLFGAAAGRMAGALMGASLLLAVEARIAKIDATLAFATLIAMAGLACAYLAARRGQGRPPWWVALMFWGGLGVGLLLKGPIVLLVAGGAILFLVALERRADWVAALRPLWGVPVFLALALPWYVAIGVATNGDFYRTALGYSVVGKVADSHQSHGGPFGFHAALFAGLFWPASLFAIFAAPLAWANRAAPEIRLLAAWVVPAWLVWELSGTKLPHYTLPLFPALACLAGAFITGALRPPTQAPPRAGWAAKLIAAAFLLFAAVSGVRFGLAEGLEIGLLVALAPVYAALLALPVAFALTVWLPEGRVAHWSVRIYGVAIWVIWALALTAVVPSMVGVQTNGLPASAYGVAGVGAVGAAIVASLALSERRLTAAIVAIAVAALTYVNTFGVLIPRLDQLFMSPRIVAAIDANAPCPGQTVTATSPYHEPSLVFLSEGDVVLSGSPQEAAEALAADRACGMALIGPAENAAFLARANELGLPARQVAVIEGLNHNERGQEQRLTLYHAQ